MDVLDITTVERVKTITIKHRERPRRGLWVESKSEKKQTSQSNR